MSEEEGDVGSSMKVILDAYLSKLPNCVNRELIDKVCMLGVLSALQKNTLFIATKPSHVCQVIMWFYQKNLKKQLV